MAAQVEPNQRGGLGGDGNPANSEVTTSKPHGEMEIVPIGQFDHDELHKG
jgi:hypothetical protein